MGFTFNFILNFVSECDRVVSHQFQWITEYHSQESSRGSSHLSRICISGFGSSSRCRTESGVDVDIVDGVRLGHLGSVLQQRSSKILEERTVKRLL